jgi:hypothetical protein
MSTTQILLGNAPALTDAFGNTWAINGAAQVTVNGGALSNTANVVTIAVLDGKVWQLNVAGSWYSTQPAGKLAAGAAVAWAGPASSAPLAGVIVATPPPPAPPAVAPAVQPPAVAPASAHASGTFTTGSDPTTLLRPDGSAYHPQGVVTWNWSNFKLCVDTTSGGEIFRLFPKTDIIRILVWMQDGMPSVAEVMPYVSYLTARKCIAMFCIADYGFTWSADQINTGCAWYAQLAAAFATNSYVWIEGPNEPWTTADQINNVYVQTYSAARKAGYLQPFVHCIGTTPYAQNLAQWRNVIIDFHCYNNFPALADAAGFVSYRNGQIANYQAAGRDADGKTVPVCSFEFGDSASGNASRDPDWANCIAAVCQRQLKIAGWAAFCMNPPGFDGDMLTDGTNLTALGQVVAANMR